MINKYFHLEELKTSISQEVLGGATTFITMSYIVIVNPKILEAAGIPFGPSMVATILSAFFGTLIMGLYAKRPFAIAPYMGENAFIAYTVVKILGYSWQTALGAIFISGALFTLLTILKIRSWLTNSIPLNLKIAFSVGIGLFLSFIGLNTTGIVTVGVEGAPLHIGNFRDPSIQLGVLGFLIISILMIKKIKGAILIGIIIITFISFLFNVSEFPDGWISLPPDISPILFQLDIFGAISWGFIAVILTVFVLDFVDTMGTLIGVSYKAGLLDKNGELPEIEKPFLADALSTIIASLLGTTTAGVYLESASGIESGGKSGLTAVIIALLFLLTLFFFPLFNSIPPYAYGTALIIVGLLMISSITNLDFADLSEAIPSFVIIILMSFSYNPGIGMTAGFLIFPLIKIFSGKRKDIKPGMWVLFFFSLLFYTFYPY